MIINSGGIAVSPSLAAFSAQLGIFLIRIFLVVFILQFVVVFYNSWLFYAYISPVASILLPGKHITTLHLKK